MELNLTDAVVVVTGANSGIGLATAKAFIAEGSRVVAGDLSTSELVELGPQVSVIQLDLATPRWKPAPVR